jgi:hypothetical protein
MYLSLDIIFPSSLLINRAVVLPFVPLSVIEELLVLDPLSEYPNPYNVGGTEWKRATEIASDLFERCPGRAFIRNMTEYAPTWRCKSFYPLRCDCEVPWPALLI